MDQELNPSFDLLERRLALMRELASLLEQVQTAVVRSDLRGLEGHTVRQRELCEALRQLESEALEFLRPIGVQSRSHNIWAKLPDDAASPHSRQRWQTLTQELTQVETQAAQLNRVYGALLRRAQRTLQIFMRLLASSANTYIAPKCLPAVASSRVREVSHV
jgi:flagellar biosynthesis/type III secretory pathway chaperone